MPTSAPQHPIGSRVRRLVETYTPDGALGRVGFSAVAGPIGIYSLMIALGFLLNPWVGSLVIVPTAAVAGLFLTVVAVFTLWPVYLAAIGRIDAPAEYSRERQDDSAPSRTERLKTRYQRGELSEDEFEREIEAALGGSEQPTREEASTHRSTAATENGVTETEHSN